VADREERETSYRGRVVIRQAWWKTGRKEGQVTGKCRKKTGMVEERE
jgi:hypothetical protein